MPNQLYILGMLRLFGSDYTAVKDFFEQDVIEPDEYGVEEPEVADAAIEDGEVVIPENRVQLSDPCLRELQDIDPLEQDTNHGISL